MVYGGHKYPYFKNIGTLLMIANMEPNDDRLMEPGHDRHNGT